MSGNRYYAGKEMDELSGLSDVALQNVSFSLIVMHCVDRIVDFESAWPVRFVVLPLNAQTFSSTEVHRPLSFKKPLHEVSFIFNVFSF